MIQFCKNHKITKNQFKGIDEIKGSLDLSNLTSIPQGFNPTVGRNLYLYNLTSIPQGFNPTVGGNLDLNGLTSIPQGFNPTVGGNLYLYNLTSIPQGFNPTVGRDLDLSNLTSNFNIINTNNYLFSWQNEKYISIDGIFCELINKKGNIYKCKKINKEEEFYIVTDGINYSHGSTIKEAKEDLIYKITNRDKSFYNKLTLDSELNHKKAIECYRVITGACIFGTKDFVENKLDKMQKKYTISQIINLTKNQFGNKEFELYFIN